MPIPNIKTIYNDALYWATSSQSKNKAYHLTRTQEAILRKLIHYATKDEKISYSNTIISGHTFIDTEVLRKEIPKLVKKKYISSATTKVSDGGDVYTRRTMYIKWDTIQMVLNDIPTETSEPHPEPRPEKETPEKAPENQSPIVPEPESKEHEEAAFELTEEKENWLIKQVKKEQPDIDAASLKRLSPDVLTKFFYGDAGLWDIDENTIENLSQWRRYHVGGTQCKIYNANDDSQKLRVNIHDLDAYLESKGKQFSGFDFGDYQHIERYGLPKLEQA